jgi:hypothetical protein
MKTETEAPLSAVSARIVAEGAHIARAHIACARRSNLNNSLTTKIDPYRFFNRVPFDPRDEGRSMVGRGSRSPTGQLFRHMQVGPQMREVELARVGFACNPARPHGSGTAISTSSEGFSQSRCAEARTPARRRSRRHGAASNDFDLARFRTRDRSTLATHTQRRWHLIPPKVLEACRRQFRISNRVADIPMPKVILNGSRIVTVARELVSRTMSQHVRMNLEGQSRLLTRALHQPIEPIG